MTSVIIVFGVVLILAILFMLFRVQILFSVLKGTNNDKVSSANKINGAMFIVFFFVLLGLIYWYSPIASKYFLPESASYHGVETDFWFWVIIWMLMGIFFVTHLLLFGFSYLYQHNPNRKATFYPDNHKLELIWTVIPAIVLTFLVVKGNDLWTTITGPTTDKNALVIEVVGQQFSWMSRYGGADGKLGKYAFKNLNSVNKFGLDLNDEASFDDFAPLEIHIPKDREIEFTIRARDVIHSVFLPHFRQKMDAVPGMPTRFKFKAKYTTAEMQKITGNPEFKYELACTEVCGKGHFAMRHILVVDEPAVFEKWYKDQQSWLSQNPDQVAKIPVNKRHLVKGIKEPEAEVKVDTTKNVEVSKMDSSAISINVK